MYRLVALVLTFALVATMLVAPAAVEAPSASADAATTTVHRARPASVHYQPPANSLAFYGRITLTRQETRRAGQNSTYMAGILAAQCGHMRDPRLISACAVVVAARSWRYVAAAQRAAEQNRCLRIQVGPQATWTGTPRVTTTAIPASWRACRP